MSDPTTTTTTTETDTTTAPAKDAHLAKTIGERDAAKQRAKQLEDELAETRTRLASLDEEKRARDEELARKAGDFTTIENTYKTKLSTTEKELAEAKDLIARRERKDRSDRLAEAVATKTGVKDLPVIRGVLRLANETGFDDAPAAITDDVLAEAIKRVQADAPSLFATRSTPAANAGSTQDDVDVPAEYASDPVKRDAFLAGRRRSPGRR